MKTTLLIFAFIFFSVSLDAQSKREFRGAWIQTVYQSEYAKMTSEEMKQNFIDKLNTLQKLGFNALIFQARPEADAWYKSDLEPWSRYVCGQQGQAPDFDPMEFLIEECHKREIEFHAWLNPYRVGSNDVSRLAPSHVYFKHPDWFITYNKKLYFDPGNHEASDFLIKVVLDIVTRYDIDAIHMDDYFYPYPEPGIDFPDDASFKKYRGMFRENQKDDWRRNNVTSLVKNISREIKKIKPWVRYGISPFGIYRNRTEEYPKGSATNGSQNYFDLYADIKMWMEEGYIDYCIPQAYWEIGHKAADYNAVVDWWNENSEKVHIYIGQDVNRTMKAGQLTEKMQKEHSLNNVKGHCFWPANEIFNNNGGIADSLSNNYHRTMALIPAYTNMWGLKPLPPVKPRITKGKDCRLLHWKGVGDRNRFSTGQRFIVYKFGRDETPNFDDVSRIVIVTRKTGVILPLHETEGKCKYYITTLDKFNIESESISKKSK